MTGIQALEQFIYSCIDYFHSFASYWYITLEQVSFRLD